MVSGMIISLCIWKYIQLKEENSHYVPHKFSDKDQLSITAIEASYQYYNNKNKKVYKKKFSLI
jgi:hypothetical protein